MNTYAWISIAAALPATAPAVLSAADTAEIWSIDCASCHGRDGKAQTKVGRITGAKDLTDPAYQKTFTDDQMFADLKNGLVKDGHTKMNPYGGKLSDDEIKALVAYVRTLAK